MPEQHFQPLSAHDVDWTSLTTSSASILGDPMPQPKSKLKLNVCGHTGHEAYTIPIRYGRAQCLGCHAVRNVDAKYTPNFKKLSFPIPPTSPDDDPAGVSTTQPDSLDDLAEGADEEEFESDPPYIEEFEGYDPD